MGHKAIPVRIDGIEYRSARKAALAIGSDHKAILYAIRKSRPTLRCRTEDGPNEVRVTSKIHGNSSPVRVRGIVFDRQKDAAEFLGVSEAAVSKALRRGAVDRLGLRKNNTEDRADER